MWGTELLRGGCSFAPLHAPRPKNPAAGQAKMMLIILQPSTRSLLCAAKSEINRLSPYCFFPPAVEGGGSYDPRSHCALSVISPNVQVKAGRPLNSVSRISFYFDILYACR